MNSVDHQLRDARQSEFDAAQQEYHSLLAEIDAAAGTGDVLTAEKVKRLAAVRATLGTRLSVQEDFSAWKRWKAAVVAHEAADKAIRESNIDARIAGTDTDLDAVLKAIDALQEKRAALEQSRALLFARRTGLRSAVDSALREREAALEAGGVLFVGHTAADTLAPGVNLVEFGSNASPRAGGMATHVVAGGRTVL